MSENVAQSSQHPVKGHILLFTCATSFVAIVCIYTLSWLGRPYIEMLDTYVGEVVAVEARRAMENGEPEKAVALFQSALAVGFTDPRQAELAAQDLARVAIDQKDYLLAIDTLAPYIANSSDDPWNYNLTFIAYRNAGRDDDALATAAEWRALAGRVGNPGVARWALYNEGLIHRDAGRFDEAQRAFMASHDAVPNGQAAFQAAAAAVKAGDRETAEKLAAWAAEYGGDAIQSQASKLLETLR